MIAVSRHMAGWGVQACFIQSTKPEKSKMARFKLEMAKVPNQLSSQVLAEGNPSPYASWSRSVGPRLGSV